MLKPEQFESYTKIKSGDKKFLNHIARTKTKTEYKTVYFPELNPQYLPSFFLQV